jgi:adenosyl cobinamide kinase/adenosyl cobinamide phosphate guanylyltransferase
VGGLSTILILGTLHSIQRKAYNFASDPERSKEREQKQAFATAVQNLAEKYRVVLIGEEIGLDQESIIPEVAYACGATHKRIDMSLEQRKKVNCGPSYADRRFLRMAGSSASRIEWHKRRRRCHQLREQYMYDQTLATALPGKNILIVCGMEHASALGVRFRQAAQSVDVLCVLDYEWFDPQFWGFSRAEIRAYS